MNACRQLKNIYIPKNEGVKRKGAMDYRYKDYLPKGKPRLLIKALLQMTMDTEDATERKSAPTTPNWKPDISPIFY